VGRRDLMISSRALRLAGLPGQSKHLDEGWAVAVNSAPQRGGLLRACALLGHEIAVGFLILEDESGPVRAPTRVAGGPLCEPHAVAYLPRQCSQTQPEGDTSVRTSYRQPWPLRWPFGPQTPRHCPALGTPRHHDGSPIRTQNGPQRPDATPRATAVVALEKRCG